MITAVKRLFKRLPPPAVSRVSGTRGHPRTHSHIAACQRCADETRPPSRPPMTSLPPTAGGQP